MLWDLFSALIAVPRSGIGTCELLYQFALHRLLPLCLKLRIICISWKAKKQNCIELIHVLLRHANIRLIGWWALGSLMPTCISVIDTDAQRQMRRGRCRRSENYLTIVRVTISSVNWWDWMSGGQLMQPLIPCKDGWRGERRDGIERTCFGEAWVDWWMWKPRRDCILKASC